MFPETEKLLTLERKYGDSLNVEDMTGKAKVKKKKVAGEAGASAQQTHDARSLETGTAMASEMHKTGQAFSTGGGSQDDLPKVGGAGGTPEGSQAEVASVHKAKDATAHGESAEAADDAAEERALAAKRKADTDARNEDFELVLRARAAGEATDFADANKRAIRNASTGRPLKPRLEIPDGMEVYAYGGQKLNIWEQQKESLRDEIAKESGKFYTYSKEHLSLAFPVVNENQIAVKAKMENEARWKTENGFDRLGKKLNWNAHPKDPDPAKKDALRIPHHEQAAETKAALKGFAFAPGENGKPDFQSKIKAARATFSEAGYFKTVFISGDDMVKEQLLDEQRARDAWNKKVVVKNTHFQVNTKEKKTASTAADKYLGLREGEARKIGLRNKKRNISAMVERQILATRSIADPPVSMLKEEDYVRKGYQRPWKAFDPKMSISGKDMDTNVQAVYRKLDARSRHVEILPLRPDERAGAKWQNAA